MAFEGIIDILAPETDAERYSFIPDNTVNEVTITAPTGAPNQRLAATDGRYLFSVRDNIILRSVHIRMPYCYVLSDGPLQFGIKWRDAANSFFINPDEISLNGDCYIADVNLEYELSTFVPFPAITDFPGAAVPLYLRYSLNAFSVSQIGSPDSLNGVQQYIDVSVKVQHSIVLS